jgi:hypothetical protein
MKCLQKKYNKLEDKCKAAVQNYTKMTMSDPTLDFLLMKACEPMIQSFCAVNQTNEKRFLFYVSIQFLCRMLKVDKKMI